MIRRLRGLLISLLLVGLAVPALAAAQPSSDPPVTFARVELDPASPATLHKGELVYLRIRFDSRVPIRIWARPYFQGQPAPARTSGARVQQPGPGEVFASFDLDAGASVDTIRVTASRDGTHPIATKDVPVDYTWDGAVLPARTRAAWVAPALDRERAQQREDYERSMASDTGAGGSGVFVVFGLVVLAALAACLLWPLWGIVRWTGGWRVAAGLPLAALVLWVLKDAWDLARDPTSHNLLPFELLEAAVLIVPYMLIATIWRTIARRKRQPAA